MVPRVLLLLIVPAMAYSWYSPASTTRRQGARASWKRKSHSLMPPARSRLPRLRSNPDDALFRDSRGREWADDGRDSLPFEVYDVVPPRRKLGVAKLSPSTSCGDTVWHGAKHYRVLRVSSKYKYEGGRFVVRKKSIDAKELARAATEKIVARLVYGSDGEP